jgi:hypothetical protein
MFFYVTPGAGLPNVRATSQAVEPRFLGAGSGRRSCIRVGGSGDPGVPGPPAPGLGPCPSVQQ